MPKQRPREQGASGESTKSILLDTHVAIWLADGNSRLKAATVSLIEDGFMESKLCLSVISAWEIGLLVSKKRLDLGQPALAWFDSFVRTFNVNVLDITPEIAVNSSYLPGTFRGDPADRIIVATALVHSMSIATSDKSIVTYGTQGFVRILVC